MGYRPQEFDVAFARVVEEHPFASRSVAENVLYHFEKMVSANDRAQQADKKPYWLLIREALNEANVEGATERKPYKSLIGYLYGKHAHYVAMRYRHNPDLRPEQPRFPTTTLKVRVQEKPNGQLVWEF